MTNDATRITPIKSFINAAYNLVDDICGVDNLDVEVSDELKHQLAFDVEKIINTVWVEGYEQGYDEGCG